MKDRLGGVPSVCSQAPRLPSRIAGLPSRPFLGMPTAGELPAVLPAEPGLARFRIPNAALAGEGGWSACVHALPDKPQRKPRPLGTPLSVRTAERRALRGSRAPHAVRGAGKVTPLVASLRGVDPGPLAAPVIQRGREGTAHKASHSGGGSAHPKILPTGVCHWTGNATLERNPESPWAWRGGFSVSPRHL